jgi:hypothetical protein
MIRVFIPNPDPDFLHIPDPGSKGKKGTGSRIPDPQHCRQDAGIGSGTQANWSRRVCSFNLLNAHPFLFIHGLLILIVRLPVLPLLVLPAPVFLSGAAPAPL